MNNQNYFYLLLLLVCTLSWTGCSNDDDQELIDPPGETEYSLGWLGEEDLSNVPVSTNFSFGSGNLPSAVDLVPLFPPMGDQGSYGTCVAWAVGYNIKTAIQGQTNNWGSAELSDPARQASPKDLFLAIPDSEKGTNCGGTHFANALDILQNRGVATMQTVPYTQLGSCSQSQSQSSWSSEASSNKIKYWRKISASVESIQENLANNIPVILGAKLADNFMSWNSDDVITSSTSFNNVGQHAYHALVIAGYDDNQGPRGAFRVINSWGQVWGDQGYIWIDYDYLINEFCDGGNGAQPLYIAADGDANDNTPPDDVNPPQSTGVDLAPWVYSDYSNYPYYSYDETSRSIEFNLFNIGNSPARASDNWSVYYIYYNAFNANDYGVIFFDEFNTSIAANTFECPTADHCVVNLDIPSGGNFASIGFGQQSITRSYFMPQISGQYYLAMIADGGGVYEESDELNNIFYTTSAPKVFDLGYSSKKASGSEEATPFEFKNTIDDSQASLKSKPFSTGVSPAHINAYTPQEILKFVKEKYASGELKSKLQQSQSSDSDNKMYRIK